MSQLDSNAVIQVGIVVRDIEKTAGYYAKLFGLEMPKISNVAPDVTYKGQKVEPKGKKCSFKMGAVSLELIEPDDTPTSWKQFLDEKGTGVHHIGIVVEDRAGAIKALDEAGMPVRQFGQFKGGNYSVIESGETLGVNLNIKENT